MGEPMGAHEDGATRTLSQRQSKGQRSCLTFEEELEAERIQSSAKVSKKKSLLEYRPSFETDLVTGHGGKIHITPAVWEGRVVWVRLTGFPWWPAQVLRLGDPFIPVDEPMPRTPDAVPVRFFGTYDFSWVTCKRDIVPFYSGYTDKVHKEIKDPEFKKSVQEVIAFQETRELPVGFDIALQDSIAGAAAGAARLQEQFATPQRPISTTLLLPTSKGKTAKGKGGSAKKPASAAAVPHAKGRQQETLEALAQKGIKRPREPQIRRALKVARELALAPPDGSPYATQICVNPALRSFCA